MGILSLTRRQYFFSLSILFLLSFIGGTAESQTQKAIDLYNSAYNQVTNKQYEAAIKNLDKVIKLDPNFENAYVLRGNAFYALKEYDYAIDDYYVAIYINPGNPSYYYNRGNAFYGIAMMDSAILDYSQALKMNPNYPYAYSGRANCYTYLKDYDKAILDYNKALLLDPGLTYCINYRGNAFLYKGNYEKAIADYKKVIATDSLKVNSYYATINILEPLIRLQRFQEAADYYRDLSTQYKSSYLNNPEWEFYLKYLEAATKNLVANNFLEALSHLEDAQKLYTASTNVTTENEIQRRGLSAILSLKGFVFEKLNKAEEAQHAYDQTLILNPNQPEVAAAINRLAKQEAILEQNDNTLPVIKILEPLQEGRSISIGVDKVAAITQRIRGQAIDPGGIRSVLINNIPVKTEENGYFDTVMTLKEGMNVFTIVATDTKANTVSESIQVVAGGTNNTNTGAPPPSPKTVLDYDPVYHAILIAETEYADKNIKSLNGPVLDMRKIYRLLLNNYNFTPENTDTLLNATKTTILETIINKANAMGENDNLFIFYAGHGEMIKQPDNSEEGFLLPQDAMKGKLSSYISSDDLLRTIKYSKAQHILFVADACFAGSLFRDIEKEAPAPVADAYKDKSRKLLASGNRTAVPDQSEFIEFFRLALQENKEKYITAEQLIDTFKNQYRASTKLSLQYFPIKNVEDLGGQFVFKRK